VRGDHVHSHAVLTRVDARSLATSNSKAIAGSTATAGLSSLVSSEWRPGGPCELRQRMGAADRLDHSAFIVRRRTCALLSTPCAATLRSRARRFPPECNQLLWVLKLTGWVLWPADLHFLSGNAFWLRSKIRGTAGFDVPGGNGER